MLHSNKNSTKEDDLADDYESIETQEAAGECELTEEEEQFLDRLGYLSIICLVVGIGVLIFI